MVFGLPESQKKIQKRFSDSPKPRKKFGNGFRTLEKSEKMTEPASRYRLFCAELSGMSLRRPLSTPEKRFLSLGNSFFAATWGFLSLGKSFSGTKWGLLRLRNPRSSADWVFLRLRRCSSGVTLGRLSLRRSFSSEDEGCLRLRNAFSFADEGFPRLKEHSESAYLDGVTPNRSVFFRKTVT